MEQCQQSGCIVSTAMNNFPQVVSLELEVTTALCMIDRARFFTGHGHGLWGVGTLTVRLMVFAGMTSRSNNSTLASGQTLITTAPKP
jgi:hypothetical protein